MAKKNKDQGFRSGAGLIRYFDAEEKSEQIIPPWFVVAMCIATAVIISALHVMYPL